MFGLVLVYYYLAAGITQQRGFIKPMLKIFCAAFGLVAISMVIGAIRSGVTDASLADAGALIRDLHESNRVGLANALYGT